MLTQGLSVADQVALELLLRSSHELRIGLEVLDLNHNSLGSISEQLMSGAVNIDTDADVSRSLTLDLLDPKRNLQLAPNDPDDGAAYPTRMVRASFLVRPKTGSWLTLPVFTGPVAKLERNGEVLRLECQGKESLSNAALWSARTYQPKWNKGALIRDMMTVLAGEAFFDFDTVTATTATNTVVQRSDEAASVWAWARVIANSMGMQLFYNGLGYLRLRAYPNTSCWTFTRDWYVDDPQLAFSLDNLVNAVEMTGGTPKGAKTPITHRVIAPSTHPLSPAALGRAGVPRYIPKIVQNTDVLTKAQAQTSAQTELDNGLLQAIDATFNSLVVPHLEEHDLVGLRTDTYATDFRVHKVTIPLLCSETMSVGYDKNVRPTELGRDLRRA